MSEQSSPSHIRTVVEIVGVLFAILLGIFAAGEYVYGPRISRLEAERDDWNVQYDILSQKTDGLFAPRLFYEDTLKHKKDGMLLHAGKVTFRLQRTYSGSSLEHGSPPKIGLSYWNSVDSVRESTLLLSEGERWEYTVDDKRFYVTFEILDPKQPLLVGRIYELNPIYIPVPTSAKGDQTR